MWGSSWGAGTRGQLESVCAQTRLRAGAGGEGQQGDVKELWQIHRDLLLWLQQLQSFVAPDCWGGGNGTPRTAQGGQELGPGVGLCCFGAEVPVLLPQAGAGSALAAQQGKEGACQCLLQIPGAGAADPRGSRRWGLLCSLWCCTGSSRCVCVNHPVLCCLCSHSFVSPQGVLGILYRNTFARRSVWLCLGLFAPFQRCS